jgi:hypothetical protein
LQTLTYKIHVVCNAHGILYHLVNEKKKHTQDKITMSVSLATPDWQLGWMMGGMALFLFYMRQQELLAPPMSHPVAATTTTPATTDTIPVYREVALRKCPGHRDLEQRVTWLTIALMLLCFALLCFIPVV